MKLETLRPLLPRAEVAFFSELSGNFSPKGRWFANAEARTLVRAFPDRDRMPLLSCGLLQFPAIAFQSVLLL